MIIPVANRLNGVKEYYFVKKLEEIARLNKEGKKIISFGIGSPDLPPSQASVDALMETAKSPASHGYQPYRGIPELREAISKFYGQTYQVILDPNSQVLPLMGSKEGILHLCMAFLNPGDEVLVPNPGYPTYSSNANLVGANIRYYNLSEAHNWHADTESLEKEDLSKVKIMWVNYPHMPTGAEADPERLQLLVDFAKRKHILLVFDNPYSLVLNKKKPFSILSLEGAMDVAVELNSLSKSHNMAGWRIGMLLGKKEYLDAAITVKSNMDSGMFLGLQKAAIKAFDNTEEWHTKRNGEYAERRVLIEEILTLLGFEFDEKQVGLFLWAKPKNPQMIPDIPAFVDQLLYEASVFFTPGEIFGSNGKGYMRASLCVSKPNIIEALERIKKWKAAN
ncbi:MAG TPA: aminotransferase class I/II-fold pyridoxal phosphate-dependent enzyme [Cytophagaceae bacterium]|jgi:LL-diaminopimelate aminotransferase|nr:aminotransferase class I/II-fold pyridoxal phosphate-dependent enzyme [Cytophagaceae bacterium]